MVVGTELQGSRSWMRITACELLFRLRFGSELPIRGNLKSLNQTESLPYSNSLVRTKPELLHTINKAPWVLAQLLICPHGLLTPSGPTGSTGP